MFSIRATIRLYWSQARLLTRASDATPRPHVGDGPHNRGAPPTRDGSLVEDGPPSQRRPPPRTRSAATNGGNFRDRWCPSPRGAVVHERTRRSPRPDSHTHTHIHTHAHKYTSKYIDVHIRRQSAGEGRYDAYCFNALPLNMYRCVYHTHTQPTPGPFAPKPAHPHTRVQMS